MKKLAVILLVSSVLLLLNSCMLFRSPAEIIVKDESGSVYLMDMIIDGKNTYVKDGKILVDLPDGVYSVKIPGLRVFKDTYKVEIVNGRGTVVLERSGSTAANILRKVKDGKIEKVVVVSGMKGYDGFEVRFEVSKKGANSFAVRDNILIIKGYNAFAMAFLKPGTGEFPDWIEETARDEWIEVKGLKVLKGNEIEVVY